MSINFFNTEIDFCISQEIVLTANLAAQLVTHIFELLLFQRNQIPLVCSTFKYLVSNWTGANKNDLAGASSDYKSFELLRHRCCALKTFNDINQFCNIIKYIFGVKKVIKSVRILFGPTVLMPKEVYVINIPKIINDLYDEYHNQQLAEPIIRNFLRTILTSDELNKTFSKPLNPTNVYMDFELESTIEFANEYLNIKEYHEFTSNCKQTVFNIKHENLQKITNLVCCQNIEVFEDIKETSDFETGSISIQYENPQPAIKINFNWYEVNCVVKGFKDNRKVNIWIPDK